MQADLILVFLVVFVCSFGPWSGIVPPWDVVDPQIRDSISDESNVRFEEDLFSREGHLGTIKLERDKEGEPKLMFVYDRSIESDEEIGRLIMIREFARYSVAREVYYSTDGDEETKLNAIEAFLIASDGNRDFHNGVKMALVTNLHVSPGVTAEQVINMEKGKHGRMLEMRGE